MKLAEKLRNKKYLPEEDAILQNLIKILEKKAILGDTEFILISNNLSPAAINYLWSEGFVVQSFKSYNLINW